MLISLHMPKCGGTSFMELLQSHFRLKFAKDYDYPIHKTDYERNKEAIHGRRCIHLRQKYLFQYRYKKCIHGHFLPYKYEDFYGNKGTLFVTWLRDPIERLISHYNYWQAVYKDIFRPKPLHRKVVEEGWTLKEFVFSEELRNLYTKFLWNFPIERFNFIGITEYYEQDLTYFAHEYLGMSNISVPQVNVTPGDSNSPFKDKELLRKLKAFHAHDYELYNYALEARKKREAYS